MRLFQLILASDPKLNATHFRTFVSGGSHFRYPAVFVIYGCITYHPYMSWLQIATIISFGHKCAILNSVITKSAGPAYLCCIGLLRVDQLEGGRPTACVCVGTRVYVWRHEYVSLGVCLCTCLCAHVCVSRGGRGSCVSVCRRMCTCLCVVWSVCLCVR